MNATTSRRAAATVAAAPLPAVPTGLTMASLKKLVPAAFAKTPADRCSERYQFIDSEELISRLMQDGFVPVRASQNVARTAEDMLTTRHTIRFRRSDAKPLVGEVIPEVGFVNGHNGGVRFEMYGGLYRLVCSNGLVASAGHSAVVGTKHFGDISAIVDASYKIIDDMKGITEKVKALQGIKVPEAWLAPFAGNAAALAFGEEHALAKDPSPLLVARRDADEEDTVWKVYNRIQENLMRGGLEYASATGRTVHTKGITRVKRDINLNAALWDLTESVAARLDDNYKQFIAEEMLG